MELVRFINNICGRLMSQNATTIEMCILGRFLSTDLYCYKIRGYKEWAMDLEADFTAGNITQLEIKSDGFIYLSSTIPVEEEDRNFVELKLTRKQFVKILDDWEEKVCKQKVSELIIKYENDEFIFETK